MAPVHPTGRKTVKTCVRCGAVLSRSNAGRLCFPCQKKESERLTTGDRPYYDVEDVGHMLGVGAEQVRRLARKGRLPPRVPEVRRWLWSKKKVDQWINSNGQLPEEAAEQLAAVADAHGGVHFDEANGNWKTGRPEVITPIVSDRSGSKTVIYAEFVPEHTGSP